MIKSILHYTLLALFLLISITAQAQISPVLKGLDPAGMAKDPRVRMYLSPTRIVWKSDHTGSFVKDEHQLLKPGNGQAELINKDLVSLKNDGKHQPGILLDFGKEIHGGIQLVTGLMANQKPLKVRIRFGESVTEAMSEIDSISGATNDHAIRDMIVELPWLGGMEFGNTGFRFVRIDLIEPGRELLLKESRAIFSYRDIPYVGSFHSSDQRLNEIWATGAYTVHLNMQQYLWDGIKRDRLVWVGDMHPEVMTINSVFGYNEVVPKSLDLIRDVNPIPSWMNGISSYSMWWIRIHRDWFQYQGNRTYLEEQRTYLVDLLHHLMSKIKNNKEDLDGNRFLDWPSSENPAAVHAGLQAMMVMTLQDGAELCRILGENQTAAKCDEAIKGLKKHVPDLGNSKQAAALMAMAGLIPAAQANDFLKIGGTKNFSTFYGYYMLQAKAKAGDYQGAMNNIKAYWGGMLDLGATTFWEDFDLDWTKNAGRIDELVPPGKTDVHACYGAYCYKHLRHSLAHGWASGPTAWLTEHVLGIQVLEAGCKVIQVRPNLGDLQFAEGTFPTPFGKLTLKHTRMPDGKIQSQIDAPKGVRIVR